jgi:AraC-like DNA-binding protein
MILRGASVLTAHNPSLGTIVLQHLQTADYNIRFNAFDFFRPFKITCSQTPSKLVSFLAIKNNIHWSFKGLHSLQLKQGQFALLHNPAELGLMARFENNKTYHSLEIDWSAEMIEEALPYFSFLQPLFAPVDAIKSFFLSPPGKEAGPQLQDLARQILKSPFTDELSRLHFEHKVREYLFVLLVEEGREASPKIKLTDEEREKILELANTISAAPGKKFPIAVLARATGMNRMKLEMAFKEIHGNPIYQHQLAARLKEAHRLLQETNANTKQVAAAIGYKNAGTFLKKFKEFFGYDASTITKHK